MYIPDPRSSAASESGTSFVEAYRSYYRGQRTFVEVPSRPGTGQVRMELKREAGQGWMEFIQMDQGLGVGMCEYELSRPVDGDYPGDLKIFFRINLMLAGEFDIFVPETGLRRTVRGGEMWVCRNFHEHVRFTQPPKKSIRGVSIDLPKTMVESWLGGLTREMNRKLEMLLNGKMAACEAFLPGLFPLACRPRWTAALASVALRLIGADRSTFCGRLHFEALALEFLSRVLAFDGFNHGCPASRTREPVDEAIEILHAEWGNPPTISALARRVRLNECYLKAGFRQRTGLSIGGYVRQLRMERALELLESGQSVLQTATAVGYSNPSHFSAAFRKQHGCLPSACRSR